MAIPGFTDVNAAAAAIIGRRGIDEKVVLGPVEPRGDGYLLTIYIGTHKGTAERLTVSSEDEIDKDRLIEIVAKSRMIVHDFDDQFEADKCAKALWPATASLR
jgi:hypothetical protein